MNLNLKDIVELLKSGIRDFSNSKFYSIDFSGVNLSGVNFSGSKFEWARFVGSNLSNAKFLKCNIQWCNFSRADLTKSNFFGSKIHNSLFDSSTLIDTSFEKCDFSFVGFLDVNLTAANFSSASKFKFYTSVLEVTEEDIDFAAQQIKTANLDWSRKFRSKTHLIQVKTAQEKLKMLYDTRTSIGGTGSYIQPSESLMKSYAAHKKGDTYGTSSDSGNTYDDVKGKRKEKTVKTEYE